MNRYHYSASAKDFCQESDAEVLWPLSDANRQDLNHEQKAAWKKELLLLKATLANYPDAHLFLEFIIPRMGKRADAVVLYRNVVAVLEFKIGSKTYESADVDQVLDYALDLKNFHSGSHSLPILPILIATEAPARVIEMHPGRQDVYEPLLVNAETLSGAFAALAAISSDGDVDANSWATAPYRPTPTIVEAAQSLYNEHTVADISRSDAGAVNLSITSDRISQIIEKAKSEHKKILCLITGVPGSGKTLAGLNIAIQHTETHKEDNAVYLSGNGPLVAVLREALARDRVARKRSEGVALRKSDALRDAGTFVQNIHNFRDECLMSNGAPPEKVVIFDEAQRAWNKAQTSSFMRRKRDKQNFDQSEPEFLLSAMDRNPDWCVVICLVGGGQEINTGEAGVIEWVESIQTGFPEWTVYCSDKIDAPEYNWNSDLLSTLAEINYQREPDLHLAVALRSYRAEKLSSYIASVIEGNENEARSFHQEIPDYPICITRNLDAARKWLRKQARGSERFGLVASSNGLRLKPYGVHVKSVIDPAMWFLNGKSDVRSSYSLEDAATEFDVQGLELDWACVCWDANFRWLEDCWSVHEFSGTKWQNVHSIDQRRYVANAYRVLMTRARQGLVIFVPNGDERDKTRSPAFYDGTYEFLLRSGAIAL